jgi:hypothetical protein
MVTNLWGSSGQLLAASAFAKLPAKNAHQHRLFRVNKIGG